MRIKDLTLQQQVLLLNDPPRCWPHHPFLPMLRRGGALPEVGVIIDGLDRHGVYGYRATVFKINIFDMPQKMPVSLDGLKDIPHETFDTFEEVVEAGWEPD